MKQKVKRIDQSPMNPVIWIIELACGHEFTKVQKSRPRNFTVFRDKVTRELMIEHRSFDCKQCVERTTVSA